MTVKWDTHPVPYTTEKYNEKTRTFIWLQAPSDAPNYSRIYLIQGDLTSLGYHLTISRKCVDTLSVCWYLSSIHFTSYGVTRLKALHQVLYKCSSTNCIKICDGNSPCGFTHTVSHHVITTPVISGLFYIYRLPILWCTTCYIVLFYQTTPIMITNHIYTAFSGTNLPTSLNPRTVSVHSEPYSENKVEVKVSLSLIRPSGSKEREERTKLYTI